LGVKRFCGVSFVRNHAYNPLTEHSLTRNASLRCVEDHNLNVAAYLPELVVVKTQH
jgi:hypothetical protein